MPTPHTPQSALNYPRTDDADIFTSQPQTVLSLLEERLPWLTDKEDRAMNGADIIDELRLWHQHLSRQAEPPRASEPITCFKDRALATVLHALRRLQSTGCEDEGCDHFDEAERLSDKEIDALCESLNLSPRQENVSTNQLWCGFCESSYPPEDEHRPRRNAYDCDCGHTWDETNCCIPDAECSECGALCDVNGELADGFDCE